MDALTISNLSGILLKTAIVYFCFLGILFQFFGGGQ